MNSNNAWAYYDFTTKWESFYRDVWLSDQVQDKLDEVMPYWCEHEAYYMPGGSHQKPTWKPRSDLWVYSRSDFHSNRISERIDRLVEERCIISNYRNAMNRAGLRTYSDSQAQEAFFYNGERDALHVECKPKAGSQEANILRMGANYLADVHEIAGSMVFLDNPIFVVSDKACENEIAVVPEQRIIFDIQRQYFQSDAGLRPGDIVRQWGLDVSPWS